MVFFKKKAILYSILIVLVLIGAGFILYPTLNEENKQTEEQLEAQEVNLPYEKELIFVTHYRFGQDTIETLVENVESLAVLENKYPDWEIVSNSSEQVILEKKIEDLSPDVKEKSYFGLGPDGYLTLYKGEIGEKQVIQTFFRIDVEKMESALPKEPVEQLYKGIPVQDLAELNSVLSTFSEFSQE